ncbi:replication initiator protein A [Fructobacillus tropaeoli]|uniref:Replication initiator A N-terminal domain-containing protein n=1 Tax=Fructobacillus tropaeoli TaxID=709323 RepID=A0ABM9N1F4_9LACO|nr:replication initiator protein A [Fructobacillus tropaeoli]GIC69806.1 replication initiator protein A [Fructobacillus tropaeoli]CAK1253802.1 hypothetical protein R53137_KAKDMLNK_01513 [Fructobacillus tropaeoli]
MQRISIQQVQAFEQFYRLPQAFFKLDKYKKMKLESKTAYAILRHRFELSEKNGWIDKDGMIYFLYTVKELATILNCGEDKARSIKKDLNQHGLLEEERQGLNKPNRLYLGMVTVENELSTGSNPHEQRTPEISGSGPRENRGQEPGNIGSIYNDFKDKDDDDYVYTQAQSDIDLLIEQYTQETGSSISPVKKRTLEQLRNQYGSLLVSDAITKAANNDTANMVYIQRCCETLDLDLKKQLPSFKSPK